MKTKMTVGNKIAWEKYGIKFKGEVRNVENNADNKTWYKIKITGKKTVGKVGKVNKNFGKFRVGQHEFNYIQNLKKLTILK